MVVNIARRSFLVGLAGAVTLTLGVAAQQATSVAALHAKVHSHLVKDGIPYHVPTLMPEVKDMVSRARAEHQRSTRRGCGKQPGQMTTSVPGAPSLVRDGGVTR